MREKEIRLLEAGFAPATLYVAVSLALAGILATQRGFSVGANAASYAAASFLLSAMLFFFAMDFMLLAMWYEEHRPSFGIIIHALYGLGEILIPIGAALAILAIGSRVGAFAFLSMYAIGFAAFNITRLLKVGREDPFLTRLILRSVNFLVILFAYFVIERTGR